MAGRVSKEVTYFQTTFNKSLVPFYICIVHTVVLFQSLVGVYCQTQHVKY
jgi:hypothetical protein